VTIWVFPLPKTTFFDIAISYQRHPTSSHCKQLQSSASHTVMPFGYLDDSKSNKGQAYYLRVRS